MKSKFELMTFNIDTHLRTQDYPMADLKDASQEWISASAILLQIGDCPHSGDHVTSGKIFSNMVAWIINYNNHGL